MVHLWEVQVQPRVMEVQAHLEKELLVLPLLEEGKLWGQDELCSFLMSSHLIKWGAGYQL
ncbi:hypothetical protein BHF42_17975 [Escherichia coli]|nr:hypothetical protein BX24_09475 [Escherichia coli O91:H21 str. 2009C-4646]KFV30242.1 hypothetical protein GS37_19890 [Escherichia coli]OLY88973.1 hypothetical protein A8O33_13775 [Escherichia coli O157:H43]KLH75548.1 hypothetical protein WR19_25490 [Escherichia coli]KNF26117.1 hypothetical protein WQ82_22340 [Escherichia coli]